MSHKHIVKKPSSICFFLNHFKHTTRVLSNLFLEQLTRIRIWYIVNSIGNHRRIIYKTNLSRFFSFTRIYVHICVDLVIPESLFRHKDVAVHVAHIDFLQCTIRDRTIILSYYYGFMWNAFLEIKTVRSCNFALSIASAHDEHQCGLCDYGSFPLFTSA